MSDGLPPGPGPAGPAPESLEFERTVELALSLHKLGRLLLRGRDDDGAARESLAKLAAMHGGFPAGAPDLRTLAPGDSFRHIALFMGLPTEISWTVTEWEPFEAIALTGVGPMGAQLGLAARLELIDGGVRGHYRFSLGGPALAPMLPAIEPQVRAAVEQTERLLTGLLAG